MKQTTYKKLLSISIATALGVVTNGDVSADVITTLTLGDTDGNATISGFFFQPAFGAPPDNFPSGVVNAVPNDLTFGPSSVAPNPHVEDCGGGPNSCNGGAIDFDIGEIQPLTFTTGFNFGGAGDFRPSTQNSGGTATNSGSLSIDKSGTYALDLTALDFSGFFNGTTFFLAPQDAGDLGGIVGDPVVPGDAPFDPNSTVPIILRSFTSNGDGTFDTIFNFSSLINQGSTFDGQLSRWTIEGILAVTDVAPTIFIEGAPDGVSGDITTNVAPLITYTDAGAVCQDVVDGEVTPLTDVASLPGTLPPSSFFRVINNPNAPSTGPDGALFTVDYTCTDSQSNTATAVRTVDVGTDTLPPVITLGVVAPEPGRADSPDGSTVDILVGKTYVDALATCLDNRDGDIVLDSPPGSGNPAFFVNPEPPAVVTSVASTGNLITFSCDDVTGNGPTVAVRTVNVLADTVKPVITLENPGPIALSVDTVFNVPLVPPAVVCTDTNPIDTAPVDISSNLNVNPTSIDTSVPTTSPIIITYNCSDASGNAADTVLLEVNVVSGQNFGILSMTVEDIDADRLAGCFRFEPPVLNPATCDNSNRFATDSSTIDSLTDPTAATIPGTGADIDSTSTPIGIKFGEYQPIRGFNGAIPIGPISPGFNFTGFPFVPFTFNPPTEDAPPPSGFVTVSGSTSVLTIESLPFSGLYQSNQPNNFFLDPDEGTLAVLLIEDNNDDNGTTRTFNYLITWSHFITSAEDPTGAFDGFRADWRLEGVITAGSTPIIINAPPQITSVTARQGALDPTRIIVRPDGLVTARVEATDPDGDNLSYNWSASLVTPAGPATEQEFTFDPTTRDDGVFTLTVAVTDDAADSLTTTQQLLLRLVSTAPSLSPNDDTDGDGVDDATEGFGDSDDDGLPEYRDPVGLGLTENRRSSDNPAEGDMVASAGRLRLGSAAFKTGRDSFIVTETDLGAFDRLNQVPGVQQSGGGIADFEVWGLQLGEAVSVVIPQEVPLPNSPIYRKYTEGKGWFTFVPASGNRLASAKRVNGVCPGPASSEYDTPVDSSGITFMVEGDDCVRVTVVDGSAMDGDSLRNGIVLDPGTPSANGAVPVGEKPQSFFEGGGCTLATRSINFREHLDWLLVGLFLMLLGFRNRRWGRRQ